MRAWLWVVTAASFALAGEGPTGLGRARELRSQGRMEEAAAEYRGILSAQDLAPQERATARYELALLLERDLGRLQEALGEYRRCLVDSTGVLPRAAQVVQERISRLERELDWDGELVRELSAIEDGRAQGEPTQQAERLEELLLRYRHSPFASEGFLELARLCQRRDVGAWKRSVWATDCAGKYGASAEEVAGLRLRARIGWRRARIYYACVALAAALLSATMCLSPWKAWKRAHLLLCALALAPALAFAAVWGTLRLAGVRFEAIGHLAPAQAMAALGMGGAVLADAVLLHAALRGRARALVLLSTVFLSAACIGISCHLFDCFSALGI